MPFPHPGHHRTEGTASDSAHDTRGKFKVQKSSKNTIKIAFNSQGYMRNTQHGIHHPFGKRGQKQGHESLFPVLVWSDGTRTPPQRRNRKEDELGEEKSWESIPRRRGDRSSRSSSLSPQPWRRWSRGGRRPAREARVIRPDNPGGVEERWPL
jgi:hypothetical protein